MRNRELKIRNSFKHWSLVMGLSVGPVCLLFLVFPGWTLFWPIASWAHEMSQADNRRAMQAKARGRPRAFARLLKRESEP